MSSIGARKFSEALYGPHTRARDSREVLLRLSVKHPSDKALKVFMRELAPAATGTTSPSTFAVERGCRGGRVAPPCLCEPAWHLLHHPLLWLTIPSLNVELSAGMAPGLTGMGTGRPKVSPSIAYFSALIAKEEVGVSVCVGLDNEAVLIDAGPGTSAAAPTGAVATTRTLIPAALLNSPLVTGSASGLVRVPLIALCFARSGSSHLDLCLWEWHVFDCRLAWRPVL